jgi:hypothetical protein
MDVTIHGVRYREALDTSDTGGVGAEEEEAHCGDTVGQRSIQERAGVSQEAIRRSCIPGLSGQSIFIIFQRAQSSRRNSRHSLPRVEGGSYGIRLS